MDYISVSKACKIRKLSVKKVLTYLADKKIIPKESQRKNAIFEMNKGISVISTGDSLRVNKEEFFEYLDKNVELTEICYTDENMELLDNVVNPETRFRRISEVVDKKLLFIDAEFKEGNYHEIAWELFDNGELIDSEYILEKKHFLKNVNAQKDYKRHDRLKFHNQNFDIGSRKQINVKLKKLLKDVDYIIAHNAYGERQVLTKNGLYHTKAKFLCTSKMARDFVGNLSPSLIDLVEYYKIPYDSHFTHYAHEDTKMARKVFFAMIKEAKEKFNL